MPISFGEIQVPEDGYRIYINNVDYSDYALNYNFKEVDNEVKDFWVDLIGVTETQRDTDVLQDKVIRLESNGQLIFKGIIERPDYQTGETITIRGIGSLESKLRRQLADITASSSVDSSPLRPIYEVQSVKDIVSEQIDTVSGVTVDVVDDGTEFGSGTFRGDHVNVLSMVVNPVIQKGGKWWSTHGTVSPWNDDILHASASRGSQSSVATFNTSGDNPNANLAENEQDFESLANWVEILGYGDGINQLRSVNFHATTTRDFLAADITASQTTIDLVDASAFNSSGTAWIGIEKISYTGKSTNTLTGVTRGVGEVSTVLPNDANTLGLWYCNDGTGSTLTDETTNFDGTWSGTPQWVSNPAISSTAIGPFNDTNFVTIGTVLQNRATGTVELWFYPLELNRRQVLYRFGDTGPDRLQIEIGSNNKIKGQVRVQGSSPALNSTSTIIKNKWHHVMLTWNGIDHILYFNGVPEASSPFVNGTSNASNSSFIGVSNETGDFFNGYIDNIRVSNIARTPTTNGISYAHTKGIELYDAQYNIDNPQSGSSIDSAQNGLSQKSFQEKSVSDQDVLDRIAQKISADKKDLVTRLIVIPSDQYDASRTVNIDDTITVIDSDSNTNGDFKVVLKEINSEDGLEGIVFHCSNKRLTESDELEENRKVSEVESRFMQGATNIFVVNETENAESGTSPPGPIDIFFEIPAEATDLNQIKFSYRNEKPRIWSNITAVNTGTNRLNNDVGSSSNVDVVTGAWRDIGNTYSVSSDEEMQFDQFIVTIVENPSLDIVTRWRARIENTTDSEFYPDGQGISGFIQSSTRTDSVSFFFATPKNLNGKTLQFQLIHDVGVNVEVSFDRTTWGVDPHSHDVTYNINQQTYTTTDIRIYTTNDADGTPTWIERTDEVEAVLGRALRSSDEQVETNLNLSAFFSGTGFKGIRIVTNGDSRHKAQILGKIFIDSRTVS